MISIVIPTYKRLDMLRQCLMGVEKAIDKAAGTAIEVLITDDDQDSRVQAVIKKDFSWATYIIGPGKGPASNRNNGAIHANGQWLVFLDDDCIPDEMWLCEYLTEINREGRVLLEGRTRPDRQRLSLNEESPINETGGNLWSCNMAITKELFIKLEGFCHSFPAPAFEDVDFHMRLKKQGYNAIFVKGASVCHPYRRHGGIKYVRSHNKSYRHLLSRHPDMTAHLSKKEVFLNFLRRMKVLSIEVFTFGPRGAAVRIYDIFTKAKIEASAVPHRVNG